MNIVGLDICKDRAVAWSLSVLPEHIKAYWDNYGKNRTKIYKSSPLEDDLTFYANAGGVAAFLALEPTAIVLEPTGVHYSSFWATVAQEHGIKILWVSHAAIANFRKSNKLPNKNDVADAYAMACYGLSNWGKEQYFLFDFPTQLCSDLRSVFLQIKSVCKFRSALIARLKLQLAHEFPEAAVSSIGNHGVASLRDNRRPLIVWLALRERPGVRRNAYWENRYRDSVIHRYDGGITPFTRALASQIDDYDILESDLLKHLEVLVFDPVFSKYNQVFDQFQFHLGLRALLLSFIYPIERFPGMAQFKQRLGFGRDENSSGDVQATVKGSGTSLVRSEFYIWVKSKIVLSTCSSGSKISRRPATEVGKIIGDKFDYWQAKLSSGDWQALVIERAKSDALKKAKADLKKILVTSGIRDQAILDSVALVFSAGLSQVDLPSSKVNPVLAKSSFINLLVSKTSAYAVRWLYRLLVRAVKA